MGRAHLVLVLWVAVGIALAAWLFVRAGTFESPILNAFQILFFSIHPFGAVWMITMSAMREKHPVPYVILAFAPYTFVWYYFARVRTAKGGT